MLVCVPNTRESEDHHAQFMNHIMLQLHWSESNIAWNAYIDLPVVCLHWRESDFAWKMSRNPFWGDVTSDVSLSPEYKCNLLKREAIS